MCAKYGEYTTNARYAYARYICVDYNRACYMLFIFKITMDDIITTLATLYTQCEKQGYQCKVSLYWVDKEVIQKTLNGAIGWEYRAPDKRIGIDFASADIHFGFGEVLLFDKKL